EFRQAGLGNDDVQLGRPVALVDLPDVGVVNIPHAVDAGAAGVAEFVQAHAGRDAVHQDLEDGAGLAQGVGEDVDADQQRDDEIDPVGVEQDDRRAGEDDGDGGQSVGEVVDEDGPHVAAAAARAVGEPGRRGVDEQRDPGDDHDGPTV